VVHTASPVMTDVKIKTAVDGTLGAMRGALKHKVKRVVVTSSVAAVSTNNKSKLNFGPSDWTDPDSCEREYPKSKTHAEKAAWDFVKDLNDEDKFELATICPGLVYGPSVNERWSAAGSFMQTFANKGFTMTNDPWPTVDVRDVAEAHL